MKQIFAATAFLMAALHLPLTHATSNWNDPSKDQYHIQTDEGPERYFRYQTLNGQYRKEKRLEDGTVVGTYGWVDADGYFRMRDYIADGAGYRILKTKNVFVGRSRPINEALSIAKKAPAEAGVLVGGGRNRQSYQVPVKKTGYLPPNVEVSFNSVPSSTVEPPVVYLPSSTPAPPTVPEYLPPSPTSIYLPSTTPSPDYLPSSSPHSIYHPSSTPSPIYLPNSTPSPIYLPSSSQVPDYYKYLSGTSAPLIQSNSIYGGDPQYEHNPYVHQNGPTYPIDKFGQTYNGLGNGYDRQFPLYDGVSVTNDGFRYYIPKQYHEEQNLGDRKSGSFGYVDPFGIRRVIYYNAGPDGFKHRKNNRYVGFDATPYDPRPY